ncbi:lipid-A-disaccharide synthase [bacterium]|nr:lipid-A-disaccharide synthase [bacterium]
MKYYIIAGEASGDLHGSNLMKELKKKDANAEFRFWGGDLMQEQGGTLVKHYRDLAFMGFIEVVMNLRTILKNIDHCKQDIVKFQPDCVILIDYPGFNLRIAEYVKALNTKVFYYISPQIWAWKQNRVHKIKKVVDKMFVILPFEKDFYKKFEVEVDFVGHPLIDAIENERKEQPTFEDFVRTNDLTKKPIIALLPGSRKQEISTMLPIMLSVVKDYPNHQFVIAGAPSQDESLYRPFLKDNSISVIFGKTYDILQQSEAALVTSGTATLETALFQVPEVVCYKGSFVSYHIAKQLIKVKYISLVNLIMDREVVKELIQGELNTKMLKEELGKVLIGGEKRNKLQADYKELIELLGGVGASELTARLMLENLQ